MEEAAISIGRVKEVVLPNVGGPHPISWRPTKNRETDHLPRKEISPAGALQTPLPLLGLEAAALRRNLFPYVFTPYWLPFSGKS